MKNKEVFWHMPGFCINFYLYQVLLHLMNKYPDAFVEGYRIGTVYGTFPGAIWNGGRAVFGTLSQKEMGAIIETYNRLGIPVKFTWTNSALTKEHVHDTYCNLIMKLADNGQNHVLVNTKVLEDYLRETYPNFKYISSTTKRIVNAEQLQAELERDYELVVLDYDLNHDEAVLKSLEPQADRVEILVDEICYPNCPKRKDHYLQESKAQLEFDKGSTYPCPNRTTKPSFAEIMKRPAFISREELPAYIERGFVNFKLVGRGLPQELLVDSILYYLVKPEREAQIRAAIAKEMARITGKH